VPRYLSRWHCSSRPAAMFSIAADVRPFGSRVKPYEKHYRCHSEEPRDEESAFCFLLSAFCFLLSAFCSSLATALQMLAAKIHNSRLGPKAILASLLRNERTMPPMLRRLKFQMRIRLQIRSLE